MKDAYSFHYSTEDLDKTYEEAYQAYHRIYKRCGLPVIAVASDVGMMGGSGADEFMAVTPSGEDTLVICPSCDYKANKEVAQANRTYMKTDMKEVEELHTPNATTIEEVAAFLGIATSQTMKTLVYSTGSDFVVCSIVSDLEINETKLKII